MAAAIVLTACGRARGPEPSVPTVAALTPDSECGEQVEYVKGQEPASLLGSCNDERTCTEYRWDSDSDPSSAMREHCESTSGTWSVGSCPQETALGGCRAVLVYERCRSMMTTWVMKPDALEAEKKRCNEISGELLAGHVAENAAPEPDP